MRYTVHFQNTTKEWVIFDSVFVSMLPGRFTSKNEAHLEASFLIDTDRRRAFLKTNSEVINFR